MHACHRETNFLTWWRVALGWWGVAIIQSPGRGRRPEGLHVGRGDRPTWPTALGPPCFGEGVASPSRSLLVAALSG